MKKAVIMMLAVASLGLTACCGNSDCKNDGKCAATKSDKDKEVLYSGILPAADAQGTVYTLMMEYEADHNFTEGDYVMVENSLAGDTVSASGLKEVATTYSEGDFRKESKQVNGVNVEYIRLVPDTKPGVSSASSQPTYFLINEDGSLTMVGEDLQRNANPALNYTLTIK